MLRTFCNFRQFWRKRYEESRGKEAENISWVGKYTDLKLLTATHILFELHAKLGVSGQHQDQLHSGKISKKLNLHACFLIHCLKVYFPILSFRSSADESLKKEAGKRTVSWDFFSGQL